jgi:hypothetical protein
MISHFKKQEKNTISLGGETPIMGAFHISTSFNLLALRISNLKGPHNGTFSYTKFETIVPIKEYWVGMVK